MGYIEQFWESWTGKRDSKKVLSKLLLTRAKKEAWF